MDINQLLSDLAILAGILLMTVLAVGPLWLTHDTGSATRPGRSGSDTPRARMDEKRTSHASG